jgi:hypothetical protein
VSATRDNPSGADPLIEAIVDRLNGQDVPLRGEEWRAAIDSPRFLTLHQWADAGERDQPTGPKVRVTFTAHIEDVTL